MQELPSALIVEDDEDLSTIFAEALRAAGFKPEIVRDGALALKRLGEIVPRVVILDMHLPHVSGDEILREIRASDRLRGVRVVVTTADARIAEHSSHLADMVLIKPISFGLLRDLTSRLTKDGATFLPAE
jgi:DNA-binding response OmpR family regulator